jgi:hypothetical protein
MCLVWLSEKKLLLSYVALFFFYNGDGVCLLRGKNYITKYR